MPKVLFYLNDTTACSFYRCFMPALWLNKIGLAEAYCSYGLFSRGEKAIDYGQYYSGRLLNVAEADQRKTLTPYEFEKEFEDIDVVVYQRQSNNSSLTHLRAMKKMGKRVYVEHDDLICGDTGLQRVNKIYSDPKRRELLETICRESDGVIVSTEYLVQFFSNLNDNIQVCPNSIDPDFWQWQDVRASDLSVGFAGSSSHVRDFKHVPTWSMAKRWPMTFMGITVSSTPETNVIPWVRLMDYPKCLSGAFTIGLAPLKRNDFNASRSALKWLEYSMAGIATVAEDFGPYDIIRNGIDGFRINGEWIEAIECMVSNPELSESLVLSAQDRILRDFTIQSGVLKWQEAFTGTGVTV